MGLWVGVYGWELWLEAFTWDWGLGDWGSGIGARGFSWLFSLRCAFIAMPKNTDIESILVIGAGPIIIGQACEFDYSGTQACKALRAEGYRVILVNSNPATIMTDPDLADRTYIEPVTADSLQNIIAIEQPDAILPTMGGQTALNVALELQRQGTLERHQIRLIGASAESIDKAENRQRFRQSMEKIGLHCPQSRQVGSLDATLEALEQSSGCRP